MLTDAALAKIQDLTTTLTPLQRAWLSGFLWGQVENTVPLVQASPQQGVESVEQAQDPATVAPQPSTDPIKVEPFKVTLLSASQTGNAKALAKQLTEKLTSLSIEVNLVSAAEYKFKDIAKETYFIIITSTQGEGEPPEEAIGLYKFLHSKKAPVLNHLRYAVFGIGDSSYEDFCQTGKDFDRILSQLGATPLCDSVFSDVDYQPIFNDWTPKIENALIGIKAERSSGTVAQSSVNESGASSDSVVIKNNYTKHQPLTATLSVIQKITGRDSDKDVRHLEIDLNDAEFPYEPGDSVGVYFENDEKAIDELLAISAINPSEIVIVAHQSMTIRQALVSHLELSPNHPKFVKFYAEKTNHSEWLSILDDHKALIDFADSTPIIAMIRAVPAALTAVDFVNHLRTLTPRSYSIASAQSSVGNEVHLTVGNIEFEYQDQLYYGSASRFLCHAQADHPIKIFIEPNTNFRLPVHAETPVIMIGAGTGIAPFRGFMQARESQKEDGLNVGENWLIFGNPHFTDDFLYQTEWQTYVKEGLLTHIDLAWSRDQKDKVYVSHKIHERGALIWQWLNRGAHIYVCGDANKMAKDVEQALLGVIQTYGEYDAEAADEYLTDLRVAKRYQRDVY